MGLILDSSILIAAERSGHTVTQAAYVARGNAGRKAGMAG